MHMICFMCVCHVNFDIYWAIIQSILYPLSSCMSSFLLPPLHISYPLFFPFLFFSWLLLSCSQLQFFPLTLLLLFNIQLLKAFFDSKACWWNSKGSGQTERVTCIRFIHHFTFSLWRPLLRMSIHLSFCIKIELIWTHALFLSSSIAYHIVLFPIAYICYVV